MSYLVSIIIPCYNVEDCVERAIESAYQQKYSSIEVICIENNSSDNTMAVLEKCKVKYPSMSILKQEIQGAPAARNKGLNAANGKFIQFLDADDFIDSDKIEYQVSFAEKAENADRVIVVGQKSWIRVDGSTVINKLTEDKWKDLIHGRLGDTCANLWSRVALLEIGGWSEEKRSSQEIDLQFRLVKRGVEVIYDQEPHTIIYERATGSISKANPTENYKRVIDSRMEIREYIKDSPELKKYTGFLDYFIFNNLKNIFKNSPKEFSQKYREIVSSGYDIAHIYPYLSGAGKMVMKFFGVRTYLKFAKID